MAQRSPAIALVGVGDVCTRFHIPALRALHARVIAASDPNPASLARARKAFPRIVTVETPAGLPAGVECALVSSPTTFHASQTTELLERGIHVLCEKPIACTAAEATNVVHTAATQGRTLQVGYFRRFHPTALAIRRAIEQKNWGPTRACLMVIGQEWGSGELSPSTMDARLSGGGVLIDVGVHLVDRAFSWFGDLSLERYLDDNRGGMEANSWVRLQGNVGGVPIPVTILLSRTRGLGWSTTLDFEQGSVICDPNEGSMMTWIPESTDGSAGPREARRVRLSPPRDTLWYFVAEWREFLSRMRGGSEECSNLREAVRVTELVEECYATREELSMAWDAERVEEPS